MLNTNLKKLLKLEGGMDFNFGNKREVESRKDFRSSANDGHSDWVDSIGGNGDRKLKELEQTKEAISRLENEIITHAKMVEDLKKVNSKNTDFEEFKLNKMKEGLITLESSKKKLMF